MLYMATICMLGNLLFAVCGLFYIVGIWVKVQNFQNPELLKFEF